MRSVAAGATGNANLGTAKSCGRRRKLLRRDSVVMQTARGLYPNKTARFLSALTDNPVRTWEYWLSKERLSGDALAALIQSKHGWDFVDAICGQSPWWRSVRRLLAAADEREEQLRGAADALRRIMERSAGGSEATAADRVRFSDLARTRHRPVVPPPRRR